MASIYEIDQRIQDCVDFETGEIIDEVHLSELQIERDKKIEGIACWIKNLSSDIADIKAEEDALAQRRKVKERKADSLRNYLNGVLGNSVFETAKCRITFRRSQSVEVTDEDRIPEEYKIPQTSYRIDKKTISEALKSGEVIEGARLNEQYKIQIK